MRWLLLFFAIPLYELLRHLFVSRLRRSFSLRARNFAERHGVRVDLFKFGGKALVREELLNDLEIARGMMEAIGRGEKPIEVRARVEEYIDEIVPAFSLAAYFGLGMRLAGAAIHAVYTPLVVKKPPALPPEATAVFLINHRSNFDYLVVGWALARRVAISYAVGEWARVFPLDALFKAFGGFFVRRGFPDPLYHIVLRRYLQLITRQGITQGIFPEGGLTRDGALRAPKVGLLEALLQLGADPSFQRELYFVPVGINYDRVLEDSALLAEARGRDRPPTAGEKLRGALRLLVIVPWRLAANLINVALGRLHRHGYVAVAFGEPVKLRDLPQAARIAGASADERRAIAKEVAQVLMEKIAAVVPATPVPMTACALRTLAKPNEGELARAVGALREELERTHVPIALGREFDTHRAAQEEVRADHALAGLEREVLASDEAEQIARLGVQRLVQRGALRYEGERLVAGPHAELLAYYARSLARP